MFEEVFELEKERDFSRKIEGTFSFIKLNFKAFAQSLLLLVSPFALLAGIFQGLAQAYANVETRPIEPDASMAEILNNVLTMQQKSFSVWQFLAMIMIMLSSFMLTIVVYSFIEVYRQRKQVLFQDVLSFVKYFTGPVLKMYLLLIVVMLGIALILLLASQAIIVTLGEEVVVVGIIVLFFLMFYFVVMFSLCPAIVVFENASATYALSRAKHLIHNKWWSTFGLLIIMAFISYFMSAIFSIPAGVITLLKALGINSVFTSTALVIFSTVISNIGTTLIASISHVALSLQYFNLVELKEGKGTWNSIDSIGNNH